MGCLKLPYQQEKEPLLKCTWKSGEQQKSCVRMYDYGARFYMADLGRWFCLDPLADKYTGLSPYVYAANSPLIIYDPDGMRIKIVYRDEDNKRRKAFYNADNGTATNRKGEKVSGEFLDKTVASLNYAQKGDENGVIKSVAEHKKTVSIKENKAIGKESLTIRMGADKISYNPHSALKTVADKLVPAGDGAVQVAREEDGGRQSPALGLFHEIAHTFGAWNDKKAFNKRLKTDDHQYGNKEEKHIIEKYETPAAEKLNESTRENHSGRPYTSVSPTSTDE